MNCCDIEHYIKKKVDMYTKHMVRWKILKKRWSSKMNIIRSGWQARCLAYVCLYNSIYYLHVVMIHNIYIIITKLTFYQKLNSSII